MLTLKEAQQRLLALAPTMPVEQVDCNAALGRYLASDLESVRTQPPADLSAMDGYAICGGGPWRRVGESRAGAPFEGALTSGQCTRISTGAHMPKGSDRVLIQENAVVEGDLITLLGGETIPPPNRHVRKAGFDFAQDDVVMARGTHIGSAQVALALAAGHHELPVRKAPKIAVLDSGDELVRLPAPCGPHQIPASNGPMLAAMLAPLGAAVKALGPVPDDREALAKALAQAADCEVLITSGGASVGDHDLVQEALKEWGADVDFWKVAIKPGKPLMIATKQQEWGEQVILGLPGNPVSSFVTCFLFGLPLVRAAMGDPDPLPGGVPCAAAEVLPATGSRQEFLRGICEDGQVRLALSQDSSALKALAASNCLIERPAGSGEVAVGDDVTVYNHHNG